MEAKAKIEISKQQQKMILAPQIKENEVKKISGL